MNQFLEFFAFELRFRLKSLSTYVYFLLWFAFSFLCIASESFGPVANGNGKVLLNGPYALTITDIYSSLFGIIVLAAIFGTSILRDFQRDTYQILFTKPISKLSYLGGRWAGSLLTTLFVYSGLIVGAYLGTFAPWADHARIGPNHLWWYLQPFLTIVVMQIFFVGSLFFAVAALTRKIFIVYLQGVALFMLYIIGLTVFSATRSLEHFWSGIFDPIGLLMSDTITRYWSVAEKNSLLLPWDFSTGYSPGVLPFNRLLWGSVGLLALVVTWLMFPMSVEALTARSQSKRAAKARQNEDEPRALRSLVAARLPAIHQVFGFRASLAQFASLSALRVRTITREVPFWAIIGLLVVFAGNNGYFAGRLGGENVWPVTYLMLQAVEGSATLFFFIVAALYAAELIWRERDTRFDGIHDAMPISESVDWLSKLIAISFVEIIMLAITMLVGVTMQTIAGYHHYDVLQYLEELYLIVFPQIFGFTMLALFVQTMVSNKFIGHGIVIGVIVLQSILFNFGWENTLLLPGAVPAYIYSDMNGYGHFVPVIVWSLIYWTAIFGFFGVLSIGYARRGSEDSLRVRSRLAARRLPALAPAALLLLLTACGSGAWFFYNAHILNEYSTANDRRRRQADYEREYKKYEHVVQPKLTAVDANVNIYPERRSFDGSGRFTLQNKTTVPIREVHVTDQHESVSDLKFDRASHLVSSGPQHIYSIYALDEPLAPGEVLIMTFAVAHVSKGFRDGNEMPQMAYNGTFFDSDFFPWVGYNAQIELDDPRRRREQQLGAQEELPPRGDAVNSRLNLFTPNSDWITYHTILSTSKDQIGIAPGYPVRTWQQDGRNFAEYSMGSTHVLDFYAYLSARYTVRREQYSGPGGPVNLEIYYDPQNAFNIDAMLAANRAGLDYYQTNFSPYQFSQYRVMEFPRYRSFAQSFPNTIPFSESIGFITRVVKPTDMDLTYFVSAHELGHQWWAHQLIGGHVEGSNMMSETLAQYSAYMVMRKKYGTDYMHRVLRHFLDSYLRGRAGEVRRERPLALVQNEAYVWYQKGGQIMYTLADYIGEDKVNLALHDFLMQYRYANAINQDDAAQQDTNDSAGDKPYPDTRQLVDALRSQTPPEYQYFIDDSFDRIVIYDNKAVSATMRKEPNGKFLVTLEVDARKFQSDGNGVESPMELADYMDIGVFTGRKDEETPLYMHREKITKRRETFTIEVDQRPSRAGIDPYNKLIDRIADDNMMDITGS